MALSYRTKLRIDHTLGVGVALVLRVLARILTRMLRRDHGIPDAPVCVAVGKIVGMGSVVYSGALCRGLKDRWPNTRLVYVTGTNTAELVRRMPAVDEVIVIDDRTALSLVGSSLLAVVALWRHRPAAYFDLEVYSSFSAVMATLSLAANRYGFYRRSADFKRHLHTHMVFFNTRRHIADIYGQMLAAIGGPPSPGIHGVVRARQADRDECEARVRDLGCSTRPLVLINVNASELMFERRWPTDRWASYLAAATARYSDHAWLLIGTAGARKYVEGVVAALPSGGNPRVHNVAGTVSLGALIALLERATMLVTSDTGPLHLAVACGCPTVSLWGPNVPDHYAPMSGRHEVVYSQTYCSPCLYHADFPPCEGDNVCMKRTPVETVLAATERLVERIAAGPVATGTAGSDADVHVWHQDLRHLSLVIFYGPQ